MEQDTHGEIFGLILPDLSRIGLQMGERPVVEVLNGQTVVAGMKPSLVGTVSVVGKSTTLLYDAYGSPQCAALAERGGGAIAFGRPRCRAQAGISKGALRHGDYGSADGLHDGGGVTQSS